MLVASVRAALQPLADNLTDHRADRAHARAAAATTSPQLSRRLVDLAYTRVDMVTRRGEFAVRGGIVDVFAADRRASRCGWSSSATSSSSCARSPSPTSARSTPRSSAPSCRRAANCCSTRRCASAPARCSTSSRACRRCSPRSARASRSRAWSRLAPAARATASCRSPTTCPQDAAIAVLSPERVATRAVSLAETNREFLAAAWSAATAGAEAPIDLDARRLPDDRRACATAAGVPPVVDSERPSTAAPSESDATSDAMTTTTCASRPTAVPSFAGQAEGAVGHVAARLRDGLDRGGRGRRPRARRSRGRPARRARGRPPARSRRSPRMPSRASRTCSRHPSIAVSSRR